MATTRQQPRARGGAVAEALLRRVFATLRVPIRFRLWDGTTVTVGGRDCGFAVVFGSPAVFRRVLRRPTPLRFGEAYIGGDLDIEGDILSAMRAAAEIEHLRVPVRTRVAVLAGLLRV